MSDAPILGILVAALGGAAVGVEREWSGHARGRQAHFGGVRTFTLLGGIAGTAGWLALSGEHGLAIVIAAGAVALVVSGYLAVSHRQVDATTETAALVVIGAGVTAGLGHLTLASAMVAISTLLLVEKSRLHALVSLIDDEELRAAARFGVMAVVVLPLLPPGPIRMLGGIRPQELWLLVLFFTGLSFLGYIARRLLGAGRGYPLAGLLAGLISSTNATFTFARLSRREPTLSKALAAGAIAACTMLFPRVMLATAVLNLGVARALAPYLAAPFAVGVTALLFAWRREAHAHPSPEAPSNPLQIGPALQMAVLFQAVLFAVEAMRRFYGEGGLLVSGAVLGLTDVDALTISMAKIPGAGVPPAVAAQAVAIGILVNCVLKAGVALVLGTPQFRRTTTLVVATMAVVILVSMGLLR